MFITLYIVAHLIFAIAMSGRRLYHCPPIHKETETKELAEGHSVYKWWNHAPISGDLKP